MNKNSLSVQDLASVVSGVLAKWMSSGLTNDAREINRGEAAGGCCSDFCSAVVEALGGVVKASALGVSDIGVDQFMQPGEDEFDEGNPLDRALLNKHWPDVIPPDGLSWDDLDRFSEMAGFNPGTHVWIEFDGFHFDSECTHGVKNFFDLPFFQRVIAGCLEEESALRLGFH